MAAMTNLVNLMRGLLAEFPLEGVTLQSRFDQCIFAVFEGQPLSLIAVPEDHVIQTPDEPNDPLAQETWVTYRHAADLLFFDVDVTVRMEGHPPTLWPARVPFPLLLSIFKRIFFLRPQGVVETYGFIPLTQRNWLSHTTEFLELTGGGSSRLVRPLMAISRPRGGV